MRGTLLAAVLAAVVVPLGVAAAASGAGGPSVRVEPRTDDAGATVDLAGSGLAPNSDRDLVIAGDGMVIDLGVVRTDASGAFTKELQIPGHVPTGAYELRAGGDEALTAPVQVMGVAAGSAAPSTGGGDTVAPRPSSDWETAATLALVAVALASLGHVAWKAKRLSELSESLREARG